ncbi:hypothetical protein H310_14023, partial [Aphanomyces invadans]
MSHHLQIDSSVAHCPTHPEIVLRNARRGLDVASGLNRNFVAAIEELQTAFRSLQRKYDEFKVELQFLGSQMEAAQRM